MTPPKNLSLSGTPEDHSRVCARLIRASISPHSTRHSWRSAGGSSSSDSWSSSLVTQLLDREFLQLRAQPLHHLGQAVESRSGLVELAAGPHRLEPRGGLGGRRR